AWKRGLRRRGLRKAPGIDEVGVAIEEVDVFGLARVRAGVAEDVEPIADVDHIDQAILDDWEAPHHDVVRATRERRVLVGHRCQWRRREPAVLAWVRGG